MSEGTESTWPQKVRDAVKHLKNVNRELNDMFTGRGEAIDLLVLAAVCHEHALLVGPPGTAKTQLITRFTELIDARGFHYLLTRFTEPSELFGPLDLVQFRKGTYHIRTDGMLPSTQIAFLDEVFQGSSPILNTLLAILNERVYHNGAVRQPVPLISLIGATNMVPDDPWLQAFADRFVLRLEVDPVSDEQIGSLLDQGWQLERDAIAAAGQAATKVLSSIKIADLLDLHARLREVQLAPVRVEYSQVVRELRAEGVHFSDRRTVKGLKLIAGAALMREAMAAAPEDFWPLAYLWNRPEEAKTIRRIIRDRLSQQGALSQDIVRPVGEILMDLETLEAQEPSVRSEAALGAYLTALTKLRKEIIADHPNDQTSRQRVEASIQNGLRRLEASYVQSEAS